MSVSAADGSEDVNDFLLRIRELGGRRDQEDEERNRKLEEEILQGRKERQARRAERARSISPTKSSPANTPNTLRVSGLQASTTSYTLSPKLVQDSQGEKLEVQRDTLVKDAMERLTGTSTSPTKENHAPIDIERDIAGLKRFSSTSIKASPSSAMPPARNSPLSWQRRPNSQSSDRPRSRPLSMVAPENAARSPRATPEPSSASAAEPTFSRDQIAQSLASKDPAWFRQTADRGLNSPAYRKNQVEDDNRADHGSNSVRDQMPGMGHEILQPEKAMNEPPNRNTSPSRGSFSSSSNSRSANQPVPVDSNGIGSPVLLTSAQRFEPPSLDSELKMSPSQGRISPDRLDRPASPTKGMGGFVQSAMMKRSDSVNKRWSVQSPGLSRGNSIASNRSSQDPNHIPALGSIEHATAVTSMSSSLSRDSSPLPLSRPTSSHSNATVTQDARPGTASFIESSITVISTKDGFVKPSLPASRLLNPKGQVQTSAELPRQIETTPPPISPSRTMDPRRWSPTKSSWLESALNKPESPKPKAVPPPQQPAWKAEINKVKQKGSADLTRNPPVGPKHEVYVGGLMRSPLPSGLSTPLSIGLPPGFSSGVTPKVHPQNTSSQDSNLSTSKRVLLHDASSLSPTTGITSSPATVKVKPETPPKKDFRTGLKPRPLPADNTGKEEPEFKNVFGQLRRTKTQNYVAPDELKDNITRGKAALSITSGPKKIERKDEFKDAILKKKEDFKKAQFEGKGITRSTSGSSQDAALPEALAKRKALGKSESSSATTLDSPSRQQIARDSPTPSSLSEINATGRVHIKEVIGSKLAGRFNPALDAVLARGPPSAASPANSQRTISMRTSSTNTDGPEVVPGPQLIHMTKARARGPRRKAPSSTRAPISLVTEAAKESTLDTPFIPDVNISTNRFVNPGSMKVETSTEVEKLSLVAVVNPPSQPPSPRKLDIKRRSQFLQETPNKSSKGERQPDSIQTRSPITNADSTELYTNSETTKPETRTAAPKKTKPETPSKSPLLSSTKAPQQSYQSDSPETVTRPLLLPVTSVETTVNPSVAESKTLPQSTVKVEQYTDVKSVRNAAALWDRPSTTQSPSNPPRARSPVKLPTHADEQAAMVGAGLRSPSSDKDGGQAGDYIQRESSRPFPVTLTKTPLSPPPKAGTAHLARVSGTLSNSSGKSNSSRPYSPKKMDELSSRTEASRVLSDFFSEHSNPSKFETDTAALLAGQPEQGQASEIKTLRASLYRFSEDGKKQLVPSHQERVLFEGDMYICIHSFGNVAGKKTIETYWWIGDEVPQDTVNGAEVFAQREARGNKLVKMRQGKERPEFFQALGGIVIIRRGSSNKYDSLAPYMLCGRKYYGQMAFDEVDFSPSSLCSGFPYLIFAKSGNLYLWKGKGSGIDELSCARLIGIDFGLTGEVEEVEDGKEPSSFLQIFGNDAKLPKSADHWRMKPNYDKYRARLFCADSTAKSQLVEISPFSQLDLSPAKVYVLDAFFEIYVIVGSRAQSQYQAFHNALMFAQEYGILAAGIEDRPMVPFSSVVLEGIPKDMKSVFRKWKEGLAPTVVQSNSLQRGRSLRILPLTAALEFTRQDAMY